MKKLIFTLGLIGLVQFVSAQVQPTNENDNTARITLSQDDAQKAKSLKELTAGKVVSGESATVFIVSYNAGNFEALSKELHMFFPSCEIAIIENKKK